MLCSGSKGLVTPKRSCVAGISCITPCAFRGETAPGSRFDSARAMASGKRGSMAC